MADHATIDHTGVTGVGIPASTVNAKGDILAATADDTVTRLAVGTNGHVLTADSGEATGIKWAAAAGGGFTHSYIGYNTVGGSTEGVTAFRWYLKKVTLASAGLIASVGVYIDNVTNGAVAAVNGAVFEDNAGSPRYVLAGNTSTQEFWLDHDSTATAGDPRWLHVPVGFYAAAGDYWLGIGINCTTNAYNVYKDGSGADRYFTPAANRIVDAGQVTVNTTTDRYSIRASLLS